MKLGPCPCSDCGDPLEWDGWVWHEFGTQTKHTCRLATRAQLFRGMRKLEMLEMRRART